LRAALRNAGEVSVVCAPRRLSRGARRRAQKINNLQGGLDSKLEEVARMLGVRL
jgi:hypothetical protein